MILDFNFYRTYLLCEGKNPDQQKVLSSLKPAEREEFLSRAERLKARTDSLINNPGFRKQHALMIAREALSIQEEQKNKRPGQVVEDLTKWFFSEGEGWFEAVRLAWDAMIFDEKTPG